MTAKSEVHEMAQKRPVPCGRTFRLRSKTFCAVEVAAFEIL